MSGAAEQRETFLEAGIASAGAAVKNFLDSGKPPHAICFAGDDSRGLDELAEYSARLFLCESMSSCGVCKSCKKAQSRIHPDIIRAKELMPDGKYKVDVLRKTVSDSFMRPNEGMFRVYIFTDADEMSPICQNALLKFTEEPPEYVRVIFTVKSSDALLDTIKSRLVFINAGNGASPEYDEELLETVNAFIKALAGSNEYAAAAALARIKTREDLTRALTAISGAIRGAIVTKSGVGSGESNAENELASSAGIKALVKAEKLLMSYIGDLKFNPNVSLAAAYIAAEICEELRT